MIIEAPGRFIPIIQNKTKTKKTKDKDVYILLKYISEAIYSCFYLNGNVKSILLMISAKTGHSCRISRVNHDTPYLPHYLMMCLYIKYTLLLNTFGGAVRAVAQPS